MNAVFDSSQKDLRTMNGKRLAVFAASLQWADAWIAKGATRTTSEIPERPYNVEYANMKEQSGNERPLLLSGCMQLKLVTTSTLKEKT